jgi:hypothetical protein
MFPLSFISFHSSFSISALAAEGKAADAERKAALPAIFFKTDLRVKTFFILASLN